MASEQSDYTLLAVYLAHSSSCTDPRPRVFYKLRIPRLEENLDPIKRCNDGFGLPVALSAIVLP